MCRTSICILVFKADTVLHICTQLHSARSAFKDHVPVFNFELKIYVISDVDESDDSDDDDEDDDDDDIDEDIDEDELLEEVRQLQLDNEKAATS